MLEIKGLNKHFGKLQAVEQESFTIKDGEILGLIGQNGAGKTTTFRMILDFITPDSGEILWDGKPLTRADYDIIGYLPEERGLYPKMTVEDQILFFAGLRGKTPKEIKPRIDEWMDKFAVKGKKTDKIKDLSKGNQQKIQLIATLIHEPKLVILDEPFSGLDPVNAGLLEQGILEMREKGAAIIFSSHNMENVETVSDHIVMLNRGQMVLDGTVHDIRASFGRTKLFLESPLTKEEILKFEGVTNVVAHNGQLEITLADEQHGQAIFTAATKEGYIPEFNQQPPTLDEIFKLKAGAINE